eukprot:556994-Pelagomonas_calceolata.AAC.2
MKSPIQTQDDSVESDHFCRVLHAIVVGPQAGFQVFRRFWSGYCHFFPLPKLEGNQLTLEGRYKVYGVYKDKAFSQEVRLLACS